MGRAVTEKPFESERVLGMLAAAAVGRNIRNASALYAAQAMRFVFPLILLPYLTTTLGPALWGVIAVGQSYAIMIERVIQYGFVLTGAREIAGARGDLTLQSVAVAGIAPILPRPPRDWILASARMTNFLSHVQSRFWGR